MRNLVKLLLGILLGLLSQGVSGHMYCGEDNCYDLLGVPRHATEGEIKRAYRDLAKRYHPDKNKGDGQDEAEAMFIKIAEAYEVLSDNDLRESYDYYLDHPEENVRNQYRYYAARYKVPASAVLLGYIFRLGRDV